MPQTPLSIEGDMFFNLHNYYVIGNSTNVTSGTCRTEHWNNPVKFCHLRTNCGQVEDKLKIAPAFVFEPW